MNADNEKLKILLVDDQPANLFTLEKVLAKLDVELYKAQSGPKALELTIDNDFALVLLDVQMPGMDGYEVAELLRNAQPTKSIPIIFITAIDRDEHFEIQGYKTGAVDFIFKPLNEEILLSKVEVFIELHRTKMDLINANSQLQASVEKANVMAKEAVKAERAKGEFLANMSHEIRTPMNAIMGFADLLADEKLTHEQNRYVQIICNSGKGLLQIIDDILDLTKIQTGKFAAEITDCSLPELIDSVAVLMEAQAAENKLEFKVIKSPQLPDRIQTDPVRIRQCLVNLIGNAIKFTETGYVHLKISALEENKEQCVRFDVLDTGIGIPKDKQREIFEPFAQVDGSASRKFQGTGLGLAITKQLTEILGGRLELTTEQDKGSTFSLTIPTSFDMSDQPSPQEQYTAVDSTSPNRPSPQQEQLQFSGAVLVAEDVPTNQMLLKLLLQKMGLEVTIVGDGRLAVNEAGKTEFDLILLDIQMPNMNGYEAARTLRKNGIKTPIIALTANAMKGDDKKCFEAGCDYYVSKPVDRAKLLDVIQRCLPPKNKTAKLPALQK